MTNKSLIYAEREKKKVENETPSGAINGSNVNFSLAHTPIATTEKLYLN